MEITGVNANTSIDYDNHCVLALPFWLPAQDDHDRAAYDHLPDDILSTSKINAPHRKAYSGGRGNNHYPKGNLNNKRRKAAQISMA